MQARVEGGPPAPNHFGLQTISQAHSISLPKWMISCMLLSYGYGIRSMCQVSRCVNRMPLWPHCSWQGIAALELYAPSARLGAWPSRGTQQIIHKLCLSIMTSLREVSACADCADDGCSVEQLSSGGWEWTSTPFMPFEGFQAMSEYSEYSTDFFDGKHFVLRGSSAATAPAMAMPRQPFRNYYQRQYPYVLAKFRCCFDA